MEEAEEAKQFRSCLIVWAAELARVGYADMTS